MASMPPSFKDHFSATATSYAAFRPTYPAAFVKSIADRCPVRELAWDAGTGNGQAAVLLADSFEKVIATDASAEQIAHAKPHPRVTYRVARERDSGLDSECVDLVTVAQALHWFDLPAFYAEVKRVLKPTGLLAVWCYGLVKLNDDVNSTVQDFYLNRVGRYWPPDRKHVENGYRELGFPFEEIHFREWELSIPQTRQEFLGYAGTWSAVKHATEQEGRDPLPELAAALEPIWPEGERRTVSWPLAVRIGRVKR
jgi:SAM-dependent methyltransferase